MKNRKNIAIKLLIIIILPILSSCSLNITERVEYTSASHEMAEITEETTLSQWHDIAETAVSAEQLPVWHEAYPIVAHALGTVAGRNETNCREAFIESYERGQRVFEADFMLTRDGYLVVRHDFDDNSYYNLEQSPGEEYVMDHDTYMASKIRGLYTPLDAEGLCELLAEYPDAFLITDSKATDEATIKLEFELLAEAVHNVDDSIFSRTIVQIYYQEMQAIVSPIYPCGGWIFTLYQIADPSYNEIADFCAANGIDVVTLDRNRFNTDIASTLHKKGIKLYTHTVNRSDSMKLMYDYGCDGFYSDYITLTDWETLKGD